MTLFEQLRADMKDAMRAKDELRLTTIRGILSACTNEQVAKGKKPTDLIDDKDAIAVLKRLVKQRRDAAEQFTKGGRPELAEKEIKELGIVENYLPQMASREEILDAANAAIREVGKDPSKIGVLTGIVMKKLGGNADGNEVRTALTELLAA